MRKSIIGLAAGLALTLAGCNEVKFENGEIPAEYAGEVQRLLGDYTGTISGDPFALKISMEGLKPRIHFRSHQECTILTGNLLSAQVDKHRDGSVDLNRVTFELRAESCYGARGKTVELNVRERDGQVRIEALILYDTTIEQECRWRQGDRHQPPRYECNPVPRSRYIGGDFARARD
jgi:hypothetical protein